MCWNNEQQSASKGRIGLVVQIHVCRLPYTLSLNFFNGSQSFTRFLHSRAPLQFIFRAQLRKRELDLVQRLLSATDGAILTISNSFSFSSYSTFSSSSLKSGANALQFSCSNGKSNEVNISHNKPFPSNPKPPFQSEARCEAIDRKMIFYSPRIKNKTNFHEKRFALQ